MKLTHKQSLMAAVVLSIFGMASTARAQNDARLDRGENTASSNLKLEAAGWGKHAVLVGRQVGQRQHRR
jgi:hypothetical protein